MYGPPDESGHEPRWGCCVITEATGNIMIDKATIETGNFCPTLLLKDVRVGLYDVSANGGYN